MPRAKRGKPARLEYSYDAANPMYAELALEAELRQVSLQQHIHDLLMTRYLQRHGKPHMHELLWYPRAAESAPLEPEQPNTGASTIADEWL